MRSLLLSLSVLVFFTAGSRAAEPPPAAKRPRVLLLPATGLLGGPEGDALRLATEGFSRALQSSQGLRLARVESAGWAATSERLRASEAAVLSASEVLGSPESTLPQLELAAAQFLAKAEGADSFRALATGLARTAILQARSKKDPKSTLATLARIAGPDALPDDPELAGPVASLRASLATNGRLRVDSLPSGAVVTIDGRVAGATPVVISGLVAGEHVVRVLREELGVLTQRVEVKAAEATSLRADFAGARAEAFLAIERSGRENDPHAALASFAELASVSDAELVLAPVVERTASGHRVQAWLVRPRDGLALRATEIDTDAMLLGFDLRALDAVPAIEKAAQFQRPVALPSAWVADARAIDGADGVTRTSFAAPVAAPAAEATAPPDDAHRQGPVTLAAGALAAGEERGSATPWVIGGVAGAAVVGVVTFLLVTREPAAAKASFTATWGP